MINKKELSEAAKINKPILQWVTPQELVRLDMEDISEADIKDRAKTSADLWEQHMERKLKIMITAELLKIKNVETEGQLMWLRGILAGFDLVREYFLNQVTIASGRSDNNNE